MVCACSEAAALKKELVEWERTFQGENGRKPVAEDIKALGFRDRYKAYARLKDKLKVPLCPYTTLHMSHNQLKYFL